MLTIMTNNRLTRYMALSLVLCSLLLLAPGCKKEATDYEAEDELVRLEAYRQLHYPDATLYSDKSFSQVLHSEPAGKTPSAGNWIFFDFLALSLDADLLGTSMPAAAKGYSVYSKNKRYVPEYRELTESALGANLYRALLDAHIGDTILLGLPSEVATSCNLWKVRKFQSALCWVVPREYVSSPEAYEKQEIASFIEKHPGFTPQESVYIKTVSEGKGALVTKESTVWIEYAGFHLDGALFDTNSISLAQQYGIYDSRRSYAPLQMKAQGDEKLVQGLSGVTVGHKVGTQLEVLIPSAQGYGSKGRTGIRPWETMHFRITIVRAEG